ncbi:thioredoxin family protein [Marinomonas sp.]|nr:thioredoxin family protein [Marinomonas sp.]MDB4837753.1 thioredoxin family protein [Marinomonas sp.]
MNAMIEGYNSEYSEVAPTLDDIHALNGWVLVEFGAPWCGHCQTAQTVLKEAMEYRPTLAHIKVFDGKGKRLGRQFGVKLWPTLVLLHSGEEVDRIVRFSSINDVQALLSNLRE